MLEGARESWQLTYECEYCSIIYEVYDINKEDCRVIFFSYDENMCSIMNINAINTIDYYCGSNRALINNSFCCDIPNISSPQDAKNLMMRIKNLSLFV
jgi:hypothetical protein